MTCVQKMKGQGKKLFFVSPTTQSRKKSEPLKKLFFFQSPLVKTKRANQTSFTSQAIHSLQREKMWQHLLKMSNFRVGKRVLFSFYFLLSVSRIIPSRARSSLSERRLRPAFWRHFFSLSLSGRPISFERDASEGERRRELALVVALLADLFSALFVELFFFVWPWKLRGSFWQVKTEVAKTVSGVLFLRWAQKSFVFICDS